MKQYLAIAFGPKRTLSNKIVQTIDPQGLADFMYSQQELGGFPEEILVLTVREEHVYDSLAMAILPAPTLIHRYIRGRDFSEQVETLESACETVKKWIDNLDEPAAIAELLEKVTGAVNVRIIGSGEGAKIAYDTPYDKE